MRAPEKGERVGPPPRPVAAFKSADITHLEVTSEKQEKTTLDKKDGAWRVNSPHDWPADQAGVKSLLDGLEKLSFGDIVTENKEKHEELGVADGKAARLVAKGASGTLADLIIGKAISGFTMVRPAGKDEVWQATGLYGYMLSRDPKAWRDHGIFSFTAADATGLNRGRRRQAGARQGGGGQGRQGQDAAFGERREVEDRERDRRGAQDRRELDVAQVNGLVQAMAALRATTSPTATRRTRSASTSRASPSRSPPPARATPCWSARPRARTSTSRRPTADALHR